MSSAYKYFTNKKGNKITERDSRGRIVRWIDADSFDKPTGQYKILEYVLHFKPTRESMNFTPSSIRDWEVRIKVPTGYDEDYIEGEAREILADLTNENMVNDSVLTWDKKGIDEIEYSDTEIKQWKVIDTTRPQYHYPETGWGELDEEKNNK